MRQRIFSTARPDSAGAYFAPVACSDPAARLYIRMSARERSRRLILGCRFQPGLRSLFARGELAFDLCVVGRAGEFGGQFQFVVDENFGRHGREAGVPQENH